MVGLITFIIMIKSSLMMWRAVGYAVMPPLSALWITRISAGLTKLSNGRNTDL